MYFMTRKKHGAVIKLTKPEGKSKGVTPHEAQRYVVFGLVFSYVVIIIMTLLGHPM